MTHLSGRLRFVPMAPALLFFAAIFVFPLGFIFTLSLEPSVLVKEVASAPTLKNYGYFFSQGFYIQALLRSLRVSVLAVAGALVIGYPAALVLRRVSGRLGSTMVLFMTFPLLAGAIPILLGWMVLMSRGGNINRYLMAFGAISKPIVFLGTELGLTIALTHFVLPFVVLNVFNSLLTIGRELEDAASNLGAGPWQTFRRVTLPLSLPGVLSGSLLAFSLAISAYVTPQYIGGGALLVATTLIAQFMTATFNWQMGATLSIILLLVALTIIFVYNRFVTGLIAARFRPSP